MVTPGLRRPAGEGRCEAVEVGNHLPVVLHEHCGDGIDLGAEVEQGERPERLAALRRVDLMSVDVGEHRHGRALLQPGALEGQRAVHCMRDAASGSMGESSANAAAMSTPSLASARSSVSVAVHIAKRNPAAVDEVGDRAGDGALLRRHGREAQRPRHGPVALDHLGEPRRAGVVQHELGVLAGEVFVVQVEPVVLLEPALDDLAVPDACRTSRRRS